MWRLTNSVTRSFFKTQLYLDADGWTIAKSDTGQILSEALTNVEAVIQAALDRRGPLGWSGGTYPVSNSANLNLKDKTTIYSSRNTILQVPNGFAGSALSADINANGPTVNIHDINFVGGLRIEEAGNPLKQWKALHCKLNVADKGITDCHFDGILASGARDHIAIEILNNTSWMTSCYFHDDSASLCANGINMINTAADTSPGISTLSFKDYWYQGGAQTEYGAKGITGNNHKFDNCSMWDMHLSTFGGGSPGANSHSAQFLPAATNMTIIGGIMLHHNLDNQAPKGQVRWAPDGHGPQPNWDTYGELFTAQGDGFTTTFTIPHGMGIIPKHVRVDPVTRDAAGAFYTNKDATNIYVIYTSRAPPPSTPSNNPNVQLFWRAAVKAA